MTFGGFASPVFLAPMAGVTDKPFRQILTSCGKGNMYAEMAAINALQRKNPKSWQIADVRPENYPVVVQLVGNDAGLFAEAAKLVADLGARSLDINMGCPVKKIVNNESGSALMKDMPRAAKIIEAVVKATPLSVSVKFRKGWDNEHINAVPFAKMCEESGASYITVHGRTQAQGYSGEADWNIIKAVKESVKIPVIGNGDIDSPQKAKQRMQESGVDGVMIGRAVLGNPWLLSQTHEYLLHGTLPAEPTVRQIKEILLKHLHLLMEYYGEKAGIAVSRKHVGWYVRSLYEAKKFREQYTKLTDFETAEKLINDYFAGLE
ncbi:MAG: tRNA dihydrouridine synthase DusB [Alphaproteobacteria bacterium]|nr:tRNA dihydrouridine synthase DusB [Alphaproteobacteria bacterium]MDY4690477.1 tRNA dihydrouridine synthase DusB [Alphaproteobacteria bacterium]